MLKIVKWLTAVILLLVKNKVAAAAFDGMLLYA